MSSASGSELHSTPQTSGHLKDKDENPFAEAKIGARNVQEEVALVEACAMQMESMLAMLQVQIPSEDAN